MDVVDALGAVAGIVLVDLALSGDNALVIGAAAAGLPQRQRRAAIVLGGAGAIVLRLVFAIAATLLLRLPFLQAIGGVVLVFIAIRLLAERTGKQASVVDERAELVPRLPVSTGRTTSPPPRSFVGALLTILVADVTMSLDNVLAIGALAAGALSVLAFGVVLSILLVLAGSALVAALIQRLPWLLDVAALVLGWTAANMVLHDGRLGPLLSDALPSAAVVVHVVGVGVVLAADVLLRARAGRTLGGAPPSE
jgi:YjbE family integral membrane protein